MSNCGAISFAWLAGIQSGGILNFVIRLSALSFSPYCQSGLTVRVSKEKSFMFTSEFMHFLNPGFSNFPQLTKVWPLLFSFPTNHLHFDRMPYKAHADSAAAFRINLCWAIASSLYFLPFVSLSASVVMPDLHCRAQGVINFSPGAIVAALHVCQRGSAQLDAWAK